MLFTQRKRERKRDIRLSLKKEITNSKEFYIFHPPTEQYQLPERKPVRETRERSNAGLKSSLMKETRTKVCWKRRIRGTANRMTSVKAKILSTTNGGIDCKVRMSLPGATTFSITGFFLGAWMISGGRASTSHVPHVRTRSPDAGSIDRCRS